MEAGQTGEGLGRSAKMRQSSDFLRCYRRGRRRHGSLAVLHVSRNAGSEARLGITASRKVGKAVVRHRLKRRVREVFRRWPGRQELPRVDIVVHLKPAAASASFARFRQDLEQMLGSLVPGAKGRR